MSPRAREAVLALDQGSSSSRVVAFDSSGNVLARAQRPVRTFRPKDGWHEHDPEELARTLESALDEVLRRLPKTVDIVAAGLACQRSTVVFFDRATLEPASRAPSWMDGRASALLGPLAGRQSEVHARSGLYLTPYYSAPKIRWFLDHDAKVRALAESGRLVAAPVSTFLIARLTKGDVLAADHTMAQRTLLLNLDRLDWDDELLSAFGVSRELLPALRPTLGGWATVERKGRRFPLLACAGDQQAAAAGLGAREPGAAVANFGTGAFLLVHAGERTSRIPGLLTTVAWTRAEGAPAFFQEGTVHAAGSSFDWLASLGLLKSPGELDRALRRSTQRVLALPAIGGRGAPRWDYVTRTAWFGMNAKTTADDLVRATAEGLALLMSEIAAAMRAGGAPFPAARVAGGLSRSDELMRLHADLLGATLERPRESEATALGAAALAAEAAGRPWAREMTRARVEKTFASRLSAEDAAKRRADWSRFVEAQAALCRSLG